MSKERAAEHKPLSFSTTMRNPARIADFLRCIIPFEGKILSDDVIMAVVRLLIKRKLYRPLYILKTPRLRNVLRADRDFTDDEVDEIVKNSPQNHKEAGFGYGWPSRFDTWYKLSMEFGFVYYEMGSVIEISEAGHMLLSALNDTPVNNERIKNIFLNALMKYQTNNPFRKNANSNSPLVLLLQVIKLLKEDPEENGAGISRSELSLLICWPNRNANALYRRIKKLRKRFKHKFTYGDEVVYDICLELLGAGSEKRNRFKINQIVGEAVDEFIRKMRITGIVSLRGNGRFVDFNSFEKSKIDYVLDNYANYPVYTEKKAFFEYIGSIDPNIVSLSTVADKTAFENARTSTLKQWAKDYSKEDVIRELIIVSSSSRSLESRNDLLRVIEKPARLEFLTSIALKQHFVDLDVRPNYHVDDEGMPTFTASGGVADIECYDTNCNSLVEVTLMCSRNQATNEMPAITRHLLDAVEKHPGVVHFSMLIAPSIHADSIYMAGYSKYKYNVDILTLSISEFIKQIGAKKKIIEMISG